MLEAPTPPYRYKAPIVVLAYNKNIVFVPESRLFVVVVGSYIQSSVSHTGPATDRSTVIRAELTRLDIY